MPENHSIASIRGVFANGKAIRSTNPRHGTVWFYRDGADAPIQAYKDVYDHPQTVQLGTVEMNIDHPQTDVEAVPVDESPFAD